MFLPVVIAFATVGSAKVQFSAIRTSWDGQCGDAQHTAMSTVRSQHLEGVWWSTPIDLQPRYSGASLLTHYGSPCITLKNNLIIPVKQNLDSGFRVEAYELKHHNQIWSADTDYIMPPHSWTPSFGPCLVKYKTGQMVAWPMAGGRIAIRSADSPSSSTTIVAFYGNSAYNGDPSLYNDVVRISTPLTASPNGNIYFGFQTSGANPAGIRSGIAMVTPSGTGKWMAADTASGDGSVNKVRMNCAPALSNRLDSVYITLSSGGFGYGYLAKLNSSTLAPQAKVLLKDPKSGLNARTEDLGTGCPMIGPDGDVFVGVLENSSSNHSRGWMLHFNGDLSQTKIPGAFGWDDTPSVVPASCVPNYTGSSPYLICSKYNNYASTGGDGVNKVALLDPFVSATEAVSGIPTMKEVAVVAGPTPDPEFLSTFPNAVREWCVNTSAVDVPGKSVILNCEDGVVYRWNLVNFTLSESVRLTDGIGEAYTSTVIGPGGDILAISNARLYIVRGAPYH